MRATPVYRLAALGLLLSGLWGCELQCDDCGWRPPAWRFITELTLERDSVDYAPGDSVSVAGWVAIRDDSGHGVPQIPVFISLERMSGWIEYPDTVRRSVSNDSGFVPFRYYALVTGCQMRQGFTAFADEAQLDTGSVTFMLRADGGAPDFDSLAVTLIPDTLYELPPENTFRPRVELRLYRHGVPAAAGIECVGYRARLMPSAGELPWAEFTPTDSTGMAYLHWQLPRTPGLYCLTDATSGDTAACAIVLPGHRP